MVLTKFIIWKHISTIGIIDSIGVGGFGYYSRFVRNAPPFIEMYFSYLVDEGYLSNDIY